MAVFECLIKFKRNNLQMLNVMNFGIEIIHCILFLSQKAFGSIPTEVETRL